MSRMQAKLAVLAVLVASSCSSEGPTETAIRPGQGPCDQGFDISIEGQQYFVPLSVLPRTTAGAQQEAIALSELLPASVLQPLSFSGKFTTVELRKLYGCRLTGTASITLAPEAMAAAYLLVDERRVFPPRSDGEVQSVCRVEALRRMLVTRGTASTTVYIADLPTQPYVEKGANVAAVSLKDIIDASGRLGQGEKHGQLDYRLVTADETDRFSAVRFPWSHRHLEKLLWVPSAASTRSLDTTGDLKGPSGTAIYMGVAGAGWSRAKHLLEVILEPAPDPAHSVTSSAGSLTDPASCLGCHSEADRVVIPVTCTQCHSP